MEYTKDKDLEAVRERVLEALNKAFAHDSGAWCTIAGVYTPYQTVTYVDLASVRHMLSIVNDSKLAREALRSLRNVAGEAERLKAQNAKLTEDVGYYSERFDAEKARTDSLSLQLADANMLNDTLMKSLRYAMGENARIATLLAESARVVAELESAQERVAAAEERLFAAAVRAVAAECERDQALATNTLLSEEICALRRESEPLPTIPPGRVLKEERVFPGVKRAPSSLAADFEKAILSMGFEKVGQE